MKDENINEQLRQGILNRKNQIIKNFNIDSQIEKARNVGDMHSNGKWVWTEYKPGKFDWRNAPKGSSAKVESKITENHIKEASTQSLKNAANSDKASPDLKEAALKELKNRGEGGSGKEKSNTEEKQWKNQTQLKILENI